MVIEHCPASSALGAVISGIDLAKPINSKTVDALKEIWAENLVMIFRNQSLSDDDLIRFHQNLDLIQVILRNFF